MPSEASPALHNSFLGFWMFFFSCVMFSRDFPWCLVPCPGEGRELHLASAFQNGFLMLTTRFSYWLGKTVLESLLWCNWIAFWLEMFYALEWWRMTSFARPGKRSLKRKKRKTKKQQKNLSEATVGERLLNMSEPLEHSRVGPSWGHWAPREPSFLATLFPPLKGINLLPRTSLDPEHLQCIVFASILGGRGCFKCSQLGTEIME